MDVPRIIPNPRCLLVASLLLAPCGYIVAAPATPAIALAHSYQGGIELAHYWVSEKLDGVRAYWDGQHLLSRSGRLFAAPRWFTEGLPPIPLDGELWLGRQRFQELMAIVADHQPDPKAWRQVRYMVFDLPTAPGPLNARLARLGELLEKYPLPHLQAVEHFRIANQASLMRHLADITEAGGEGLMLHRADAPYRSGRSHDLLKLKSYQDDEAMVIGHIEGKGKYRGMLGALLVRTPNGTVFRIGTGMSDAERSNPPPVGSQVTYRYRGQSADGIPRFASFLRLRPEE